ncbi:MAG: hypothetical protein U0K23_11300 [Selenomonadaceae bacterium]|nr:hypothetical protein [Selenomonadaceae bacterium]
MAVNTRKSDKVGLLKINRTNDAVFKNIFANKKYKDITLSFINDKEEIDNYKLKTLNRLEKWICYFSKRTSEKELEAIAMTEPAIKKALDAESIFMHDKTMWWEYEKAEKTRRDKIAQMNYWKNEARLEGLQQGIQQGSLSTLINLVKKGMLTVQEAAEEAGMSVAEFQNKI